MNPSEPIVKKLKLNITTLTIKTLETKATPISSISEMRDEETGQCTGCPRGGMGKVAAVAYF